MITAKYCELVIIRYYDIANGLSIGIKISDLEWRDDCWRVLFLWLLSL